MEKPRFHAMALLLEAAEISSLNGKPAAVGAFNVNFFTQAEGILEGLRRADAPGIIQASKGANKFQGGPDKIAYMIRKAMEKTKHRLPVALHLDHGDMEKAKECVDNGYSSVMIDASNMDYEENLSSTRDIVKYAHKKGVSVEGEYGKLEGVEEDVVHERTTYADPFMVPNFFNKTGADALAVAYGTSHGPNKGAGIQKLAIPIVESSYRGLQAYRLNLKHFLVGHGSSTVPPDLVAEINNYGGSIAETHGVPMDKIKAAIVGGIRKVNIDTDLRLGITATFRKYFHDHPGAEKPSKSLMSIKQALDANPSVIDPRDYLGALDKSLLREDPKGTDLEEVMEMLKERIASHVEMLANEFGSVGLGLEVRNIPLEEMAKVYKD